MIITADHGNAECMVENGGAIRHILPVTYLLFWSVMQ